MKWERIPFRLHLLLISAAAWRLVIDQEKSFFFPPNLLIIYLIFVSPDKKFSTEIENSRKKLSRFLLGCNSLLLFLPEIGSIRYVNARNKVNRICYFLYATSPWASVVDSHVITNWFIIRNKVFLLNLLFIFQNFLVIFDIIIHRLYKQNTYKNLLHNSHVTMENLKPLNGQNGRRRTPTWRP